MMGRRSCVVMVIVYRGLADVTLVAVRGCRRSQCVGLLLGRLHLGREPSRGDLRARLYGQRLRARDRKQPEDVRLHQGSTTRRACNT